MPAERDRGQPGRYFEMNSLVSASVEGVRAQRATVGEARLSSVASQEACGTECRGVKEADSRACGCVVRECVCVECHLYLCMCLTSLPVCTENAFKYGSLKSV